jgi:hypothetical protein
MSPWRFRRSIRILPGVRLNLSRRGPSVSVGEHGVTTNVGPDGPRTSLNIPGTGLSYTTGGRRRRPRRHGGCLGCALPAALGVLALVAATLALALG